MLSISRFDESSTGFVKVLNVMLSHFFWQDDLQLETGLNSVK